jgi:N-acetylneuraminic acid mutarotase
VRFLVLLSLASCASPARWSPLEIGRYEFQAIAWNGHIFILGGMDERSDVAGTVAALDVASNRWTSKAPLRKPRYFHCGAAVLGRLYALGGSGENRSEGTLASVERYDPALDRWEDAPDLPHSRSHAVAVAAAGKLYVIGGYEKDRGNVGEVDLFDPRTNAWSTGPPLPVAVHGCAAAVVNGKIHVMGGDDAPRQHLVLHGDVWKPAAPLPAGRLFARAEELGGRLYLIGGGSNEDASDFRSTLEYDPATDAWSRKADAPHPFYHFDTASVGSKIFAIGGIGLNDKDPRAFRHVVSYDPAANRWSE